MQLHVGVSSSSSSSFSLERDVLGRRERRIDSGAEIIVFDSFSFFLVVVCLSSLYLPVVFLPYMCRVEDC